MQKAIKAGDLEESKHLSTAGILKSDIIFRKNLAKRGLSVIINRRTGRVKGKM